VTTTALALAATWPLGGDGGVRPVVVEAAVWGGGLTARFGLPHTPGLLDVAATVRKPHPGSLLGAVAELPFGVRAVIAPVGRRPCLEAVRLLDTAAGRRVLLGEQDEEGTVLVDVGHISEDVKGLVEAADEVVLVARGGAEALTHVYAYAQDPVAQAAQVTLAVIGPCPYPQQEIAGALGIGRVALLPWDVRAAAVLGGQRRGALRSSGFRKPPLMSAARSLARRLAGLEESAPDGLAGSLAQLRAAT
jgi:hypothetical protein